jgi:hypothetical protein
MEGKALSVKMRFFLRRVEGIGFSVLSHSRRRVHVSAGLPLVNESVCTSKAYTPHNSFSFVLRPVQSLHLRKANLSPPWLANTNSHRPLGIPGYLTLSSSSSSRVLSCSAVQAKETAELMVPARTAFLDPGTGTVIHSFNRV